MQKVLGGGIRRETKFPKKTSKQKHFKKKLHESQIS